jgi:hypothetical protein
MACRRYRGQPPGRAGAHVRARSELGKRCCALALRPAVVLTGRGTVACCFITVSSVTDCSVTDPAGTARICGDDYQVTTTNFGRLGRTLGTSPGQRTTPGADNESRAC